MKLNSTFFRKKQTWIALTVLAALAVPFLLRESKYALLLYCMIGIYIISTSGLNLLLGYSGQMSLGQAGFYAIGAYTSAILSKDLGLPPLLTILIGALLASVVAVLLAYPASKLVYHFLALVTIAFGQIVYLLIIHSPGDITHGLTGIRKIPPVNLFGISFDTNFKFAFLIIALVLLFLYIKVRLIDSRIGRAFIAIRDDKIAANGMGIHVRKFRVLAFAIAAFFTATGGALYAHLVGYISPETFTADQSVLFLTITLFGGLGTVAGPVIGSVVVLCLREILQFAGTYQMIIFGGFIVLVLLFMPKGIAGFFQTGKRKAERKG